MAFSKQEYWRGLPFLSPGDLPDPRIRFVSLMSPTLAVGFSIIWVIRESPLNVGRNGLGFSIWILLLLFSHSVMSDSLQPHGLQHARLLCLLPTLGVCSNSWLLSWWCNPTILTSITPFSSCSQCFPATGSFLKSHLYAPGGQGTDAETISPSNEYLGFISFSIDWFDLLAIQRTLKNLI